MAAASISSRGLTPAVKSTCLGEILPARADMGAA
jgi:hypothetical protein